MLKSRPRSIANFVDKSTRFVSDSRPPHSTTETGSDHRLRHAPLPLHRR
ncbi:Uncharacterised protein [Vibrio cholerae]|nr:Uncharacterised protein [Vibrio cholerae]CSC46349.1 Uncharacterised protein [Vibrio cholerae]